MDLDSGGGCETFCFNPYLLAYAPVLTERCSSNLVPKITFIYDHNKKKKIYFGSNTIFIKESWLIKKKKKTNSFNPVNHFIQIEDLHF